MPKFEVITIERQLVERRVKYIINALDREEIDDIIMVQEAGFEPGLIESTEVIEEFDVEDGLQSINVLDINELTPNDRQLDYADLHDEPIYSC